MPTTGNCEGCRTWEEGAGTGDYFAAMTVLHELGHCAVALDHVDRLWDADGDDVFENTSFTMSVKALDVPSALDDGADNIRGSRDDYHTGPTGGLPADSVSWFRRDDNDPFIVDATTIDINSYSRSLSNLPPTGGHTWGASGNRVVGDALGYANSQAVMYAGSGPGQYPRGLSADDVNMVKMGMTGEFLIAGDTDDYTIDLLYVGQCGAAGTYDIKVLEEPIASGSLGTCSASYVAYSFLPSNPLTARHFSLVADPFTVKINGDIDWNYTTPLVFLDGFESGDTSAWDATVP